MTVEHALHLLGTNQECTIQELNVRFRKLAKKYHPDAGGMEPHHAHEKMTQLNAAFETALDYIRMKAYVNAIRSEPGAAAQPESIKVKNTDRESAEAQAAADMAVDTIRDAVFTYYQYGLENVHQRSEGTGRFKYRQSVRKINHGLMALKNALSGIPESQRQSALVLFTVFSEAFRENMLISRFYTPTSVQIEANGYRHYRTGSTCLDLAIRDFFCRELSTGKSGRYCTSDNFQIIEKELMEVLTRYYTSSWTAEAFIKMKLMKSMISVMPLFKFFL